MGTTADYFGTFSFLVKLQKGKNQLQARASDKAGNCSDSTALVETTLDYQHPKKINEFVIAGDAEASLGQKLEITLSGEDASPEADTTLVQVTSEKTDSRGIELEVVETGPNTGVFQASIEISQSSDPVSRKIGARIDGETITCSWMPDPATKTTRVYRDRVPPSSPVIQCPEVAPLWWNTFEESSSDGLKQWLPLDSSFGAHPGIETEEGNHFLRMRPIEGRQGHLGVSAWRSEYSVRSYPYLAFDFREEPGTSTDLLLFLTQPPVGWKAIALTDDEPYFARLGRFWGVVGDGRWHRAQANLLTLLQERYPGLADYRVREIVLADWDGGQHLFGTKFFSSKVRFGESYDVDNFQIGKILSTRQVTFQWTSSDDSGIGGYSQELDQAPNTVPSDSPQAKSPSGNGELLSTPVETKKPFSDLGDGQWWFHVRAKDRLGNWGPPNHYLAVIDTAPPVGEAAKLEGQELGFEGAAELSILESGTGLDLTGLSCNVDGRRFQADGEALGIATDARHLAFRPARARPYPIWFMDGTRIVFELGGLKDYAGNLNPQVARWTMTAKSPIAAKPSSPNGWFDAEPQLSLHLPDGKPCRLEWMRSLQGDKLAEQGCHIREIALVQCPAVPVEGQSADSSAIPPFKRDSKPILVAEVKVDKTVPKTAVEVIESERAEGKEAQRFIRLSHSEYAYRRGGLYGRYYRKPDFTELLHERVDSTIFFQDDRGQYTAPVAGARSVRWEGAVYASETGAVELELALWKRAPASGRAWIDGELLFDLTSANMAVVGYQKKKVLLTEGLHELRLEFGEPSDREWQFALFRWGKGAKGEDIRDTFGPKELYYPESLGTTYYRWNDEAPKVYSTPFAVPTGKNVLRFYTKDQAGHVEQEQAREFAVGADPSGTSKQGP